MKDIVKLLFETGMLGRVKRSGDWLTGLKDSESISEHSHRASIFGYIIAKLENADENKVLKMMIFHDLPETRLLDRNKVSARYYNIHEAEKHAFDEQMSCLPKEAGDELRSIFNEMERKESKEAIIAKDADYLEAAVSAKESTEKGYDMKDWINNVEKALKTKSAKQLLELIKKSNSNDWWRDLKYIADIKRGDKKWK